jgi:hypothetical protein
MNLDNLATRSGGTEYTKKLFTGLGVLKILAVNPTHKELAALLDIDIEKVKEPNYTQENSMRLDFWYKNHESVTLPLFGKFSIFISNEPRISQSGKHQYIDANSRTCWADSISDLSERNSRLHEMNRMDLTTVRAACRGEEDLYQLMKAYGNIDISSGPFMLDDYSAICKGKFTELRDFFEHFNKREGGVKVLMGVKDGQYQDVLNLLFLSVHAKISDYVRNKITNSEYGYKHYYGHSFELKEFVPTAAPETSGSDSDIDWSSPATTDPFGDEPTKSDANFDAFKKPSNDDDDLF